MATATTMQDRCFSPPFIATSSIESAPAKPRDSIQSRVDAVYRKKEEFGTFAALEDLCFQSHIGAGRAKKLFETFFKEAVEEFRRQKFPPDEYRRLSRLLVSASPFLSAKKGKKNLKKTLKEELQEGLDFRDVQYCIPGEASGMDSARFLRSLSFCFGGKKSVRHECVDPEVLLILGERLLKWYEQGEAWYKKKEERISFPVLQCTNRLMWSLSENLPKCDARQEEALSDTFLYRTTRVMHELFFRALAFPSENPQRVKTWEKRRKAWIFYDTLRCSSHFEPEVLFKIHALFMKSRGLFASLGQRDNTTLLFLAYGRFALALCNKGGSEGKRAGAYVAKAMEKIRSDAFSHAKKVHRLKEREEAVKNALQSAPEREEE